MTYYEILEVAEDASVDEIVHSYHRLARKWHPDVNPSREAHDRMVELNFAKAVLSDPVKRAEYDASLEAARSGTATAEDAVEEWARSAASAEAYEQAVKDADELFRQVLKAAWSGTEAYRREEAGCGSTLFVGFASWLVVLLLCFPPGAIAMYFMCKTAFFPRGRFVGVATILGGMGIWLVAMVILWFILVSSPADNRVVAGALEPQAYPTQLPGSRNDDKYGYQVRSPDDLVGCWTTPLANNGTMTLDLRSDGTLVCRCEDESDRQKGIVFADGNWKLNDGSLQVISHNLALLGFDRAKRSDYEDWKAYRDKILQKFKGRMVEKGIPTLFAKGDRLRIKEIDGKITGFQKVMGERQYVAGEHAVSIEPSLLDAPMLVGTWIADGPNRWQLKLTFTVDGAAAAKLSNLDHPELGFLQSRDTWIIEGYKLNVQWVSMESSPEFDSTERVVSSEQDQNTLNDLVNRAAFGSSGFVTFEGKDSIQWMSEKGNPMRLRRESQPSSSDPKANGKPAKLQNAGADHPALDVPAGWEVKSRSLHSGIKTEVWVNSATNGRLELETQHEDRAEVSDAILSNTALAFDHKFQARSSELRYTNLGMGSGQLGDIPAYWWEYERIIGSRGLRRRKILYFATDRHTGALIEESTPENWNSLRPVFDSVEKSFHE